MSTAVEVASAAGPGIGTGIGAWAGFRFIRWLVEFVFARLDVSRSHLGQRLKHVEEELDDFRDLAMMLLGVVAKIDPDNPALVVAAERLRRRAPRATLELDELERRLREGGTNGN